MASHPNASTPEARPPSPSDTAVRGDGVVAPDLAVFAQVTGGVAPALNDLLSVITGQAAVLLDGAEIDAATRESLHQIYTAGERAAGLIRQMLLFSGHERAHRHLLDLNRFLEETGGTLRRALGAGIALEVRPAAGRPLLSADPGLLEQLLLILAGNARDAMPEGGFVLVTAAVVTLAEPDLPAHPGGRTGRFVLLRVADSGGGIPPEIRPRIFEPFFTTKPAGRGAGLGLAALLGIVRQHDGWLDVASPDGAGAEFRIHLPAADADAVLEPAATGGDGRGRETLLFVEDDFTVREFTAAVLHNHGYRVLQAASTAEALETWKWHHPRIKLLLTDMVLEDQMSGLDLARRLRADQPGLPVICTSGHGREIMGRDADGIRFLQKPCRPQTLVRAVRTLLDSPAP